MPTTAKKILLIFVIFCSGLVSAQTSFLYVPIKNDSVLLDNMRKTIREKWVKDSLAISGDNKKALIKEYKIRFDELDFLFTRKELIGSDDCNRYLNAIANEILKGNPQLQQLGTRFLFCKTYWPNAASWGEGTIIFNISLFDKLENESQAAFIICHELAHLFLDHTNKAINQYVATVNSKEFQEELKAIKKSTYEQNKRLDQLAKGFAFKNRRHSRNHESEADSLGLVFLKNTAFSAKEALTALALLDNIDKDDFDTEKTLPVFFNFAEHPFQNRWIKKENAFFGASIDTKITTAEEDSLKTHPDCKARVKRLTPAVEWFNDAAHKKFVVNEEQFNKLKEQFRFEITNYCFEKHDVSRSLFCALKLFQKDPQNAYLAGMIGKCLNAMYENQKVHTLDNIVDRSGPYVEKNYNLLLQFIENIGLTDISSISYYFLKQYQTKFGSDKTFSDAWLESSKNFSAK